MSDESRLMVVIGTSPVGMAVMRRLLAERPGQRVRAINRSGRAEAPAGVEVVGADVSRSEEARRACAGASVVYNCAQPPYTRWPESFPKLQEGIIDGAAHAGAKLISAENLYMYGRVSGPLSEDLPYAAHTRKGRTRARMAEALLSAHRSGKVRAAIGRASNYYGPGALQSVVGERVFYPILAGHKVSMLGDLDAPHTYTYIDDFAEGLVTLGERDEALGEVWHIPSAPTLTTREFLILAFEEAGMSPKLGTVPGALIRLLGLFDRNMREVAEMLYEFEEPFVVDHSKYELCFGNQSTPHRIALGRALDWYRAHPRSR